MTNPTLCPHSSERPAGDLCPLHADPSLAGHARPRPSRPSSAPPRPTRPPGPAHRNHVILLVPGPAHWKPTSFAALDPPTSPGLHAPGTRSALPSRPRPLEPPEPARPPAPSTRNWPRPPWRRAPGSCVARSTQAPPAGSLAPPPGRELHPPPQAPPRRPAPRAERRLLPRSLPAGLVQSLRLRPCPGPSQPAMEGDVPAAAAAARYQPASPPRDACVYNSCYW